MKKSKFLKKSLAMLLAVMLVVAMIPFGASAAAPTFAQFKVNSTDLGTGTSLNATVSASEFKNAVTVNYQVGAGQTATLAYADGAELTNGADVKGDMADTAKFTKSGNVYTAALELTNGDDEVTKYTLAITVKPVSADYSIKSVTVKDSLSNAVITTNESKGTYRVDVSVPFGKTYSASDITDITMNDSEATYTTPVAAASSADHDFETTVTSESGLVRTYDIYLNAASALTKFSVKGETEVEIDDDNSKIVVKMPYVETLPTTLTVPVTFTAGIGGSVVKIGTDTATSGKEYDLKASIAFEGATPASPVNVEVTYKTFTKTYALHVLYVKDNADAAITALDVKAATSDARESVASVSDNMTATVAAGIDLSTTTIDVILKASKGSKISIPLQSGVSPVVGNGDTEVTLAGVNASSAFVITVKSEDGETTKDYKLTVTSRAGTNAPAINSMSLKDTNNENAVYNAAKTTVDGRETFTLKVPFGTTVAELQAMTLIFTTNQGTVVKADTTVIYSGVAAAILPDAHAASPANKITLTATVSDSIQTKTVSYDVVTTTETAKTGKTLTALNLTTAASDPTDEDTFKAVAGEETQTVPTAGKVTTLKTTLPYSVYWTDYGSTKAPALNALNVETLTLTDGSAAYYNDGTNYVPLLQMDETGAASINLSAKTGVDAAAKVVVLDETHAYNVKIASGATAINAAVEAAITAKKATTYYLYATPAAAQNGSALKTFELESEAATVSSDTITLAVPYSYADGTTSMVVEFTADKGAGLFYGLKSGSTTQGDMAKKIVSETTEFTVDNNAKITKINGTSVSNIDKLYVVNEGGKAVTTYNLALTVAAQETGTAITKFSVANTNGTISGTTINVTVPYGTNLASLVPTFTTSKMAKVTLDGVAVESETTVVDFTKEVKLLVTAEDGVSKDTYTVKVTAAAAFDDVSDSAWYYAEVMEAAAAGIVNGVGNNKFNPGGNVTRADFAVMIARLLDADLDSVTTDPFTDVAKDKYYFAAIAYGSEKGYLNGYSDGTFKPTKTISREEMAKILADALELDEVTEPATKFADDSSIAAWAKPYVYACQKAEVMAGKDGNKFAPKATATRAEAAAVLVRTTK